MLFAQMLKKFIHAALPILMAIGIPSVSWAAACSIYQSISIGETKNGTLSATGCVDNNTNGKTYYLDIYKFSGTIGQQISILNTSSVIDPDLFLIYPDGTTYLYDNNSGGGTSARIPASGYLTLSATGTYSIYASASVPKQVGTYTLQTASNSSTQTTGTGTPVVEFYNTPLDNYFITANAGEAAAIDNGSAGTGWSRTGNTFNSGGSTSVCRFYGSMSPGPNSHFYTADSGECDYLKQLQANTPSTQKRWNFESYDFLTTVPTNGICPTGTTPVYRAYNNGSARGRDSNHRITSSLTAIQQEVARGWSNEGVVMCAPSVGNGTTLTLMTNPTDGEILSAKGSDGTTVNYFGTRDANGIPADIDQIEVTAADGKTTRITLDSAKRPSKMRSPDDVVFDLTYNGNLGVVTAVSPDGLTTVNTTFTVGTAKSSTKAPTQVNANFANQAQERQHSLVDTLNSKASSIGEADWRIQVKRCDVGVGDAIVWYTSEIPGVAEPPHGGAEPTGGGNYVAHIPTGLKPSLTTTQQIVEAAASIETIINDKICDPLGVLPGDFIALATCPAIGLYLVTVTGPGGLAIGTGCAAVAAAAKMYCDTLGAGGPPGSPSLASRIIDALQDAKAYTGNITLKANAAVPGVGGYEMATPIEAPANGPFPPATITINDVSNADYCNSLLDGTWSGTWNIVGTGGNGCNYTDGGDITITLSHDATQTIFYSGTVDSAAGVHFLYDSDTPAHPKCSLAKIETSTGGQATANRTGDSVNVSISLPNSKNTQKYTGTLKLINNKTLSGNITSSWSAGSITLTKQ